MIPKALLERLVCPVTKQKLHPAKATLLTSMQEIQARGELKNLGGEPIADAFEELLVREDGAVAYRVSGGIPRLVESEGIALPAQ